MAKRLHIVGLARSGTAAALLARRKGFEVSATDAKAADAIPGVAGLREAGVKLDLGGHDPALFLLADLIVISPGVGDLAPVQQAEAAGVPVISEVEFASRFFTSNVVAVTGTNGKSTVTSMIGAILGRTGKPVWVGGNLGTALSAAVDDAANCPEGWIVLELSSFQLERVVDFRPRIAVFLNLTPDHFDRYPSLGVYAAAKCNIFRNQEPEDHLLVPAGDAAVLGLCSPARSAIHPVGGGGGEIAFDGKDILLRSGGIVGKLDPAACGLKNGLLVHNALFAVLAAALVGATLDEIGEGLRAFKPLRHRFELVAEKDGVRWINDSKATNPDSTVKALESAGESVILLAGGLGKGLDFKPLTGAVCGKIKKAILFGQSADEIGAVIGELVPVERAASLAEAVRLAHETAAAGDTVLLAPACASYDMFRNFEDRGDQFVALVKEITERGRLR